MKKTIISSVIFTLLISCFTLSAQDNTKQVHDIDQKLSLKEQLDMLQAGKDAPAKIEELQDEKLTPEEREEINRNSKIPNAKNVDEIEDREESIAPQQDLQPTTNAAPSNISQPEPEAPAPKQASNTNSGNIQSDDQPVPEKTGTPTVYKKGSKEQPEGKPKKK